MMKSKIYSITLIAGLLGLLACNDSDTPLDTPTSGNINISVDETFRPIIESGVNTFEGIYTRANIDDAYKAEGQVVEDLLTDSTRIAILSRELTPDEVAVFDKQKRIPRSTKIAIDAVALIVNKENPDSLLTVEELKRIFSGQATTWQDLDESTELGDITVVFDNNNSSTARYVRDSLTTNQKLPGNSFAAESHEALIDYVAENKNAIGVLGVNWISDQDDTAALGFMNKIRVVGVSEDPDPITTESFYQPYQAYIAQEKYPLRRNLYVISTEGRSGLGTGFAAYLAGDKGQRLILKSGLVPATMPVRIIGLGNQ